MRTTSTSFLVAAGMFAAAGTVHANAFLLNEHDAAAVGRGDAVTATDVDGSAIVYNPGGVAIGDGTRIQIGSALVIHSETFNQAGGGKTDSTENPSPLPELYITHKVNSVLAVGLGFHTPFGASIEWPATSPQANVVRLQSLKTYFITAAVGLDLDKWVHGLSIGGVFDVVPASVELKQDIYFGDTTGNVHLGGNAVGFGGGVGLMWQPAPQVSVGAVWHSQVKEDFTGNANFTAAAPFRSSLPPDGSVSTSIKLSQNAQIGLAFRPTPKFEIEVDGQWVDWSKFHDLDITLPDGSHAIANRNFHDTWGGRIGLQYMPNEHLALRVGYIYDPTPVPKTTLDATLPDIDRNDITAGFSYYHGNYDVAFGILYVIPYTRDTDTAPGTPPYKGSFDISGVVPTLTLGGRFGT